MTMTKHRRRSIFRNDYFGIKEKVFMWRMSNKKKKLNHLMGKQLESLLNLTMDVGIPRTEEACIALEKVYGAYQSLANRIENDMKRLHGKICVWRND